MKIHKEALLLCFANIFRSTVAVSGGECIDLNGRTIGQGIHYVAGPDPCLLCECDEGSPKFCKSVLCSPPQDCKSFRMGNSCCEFICLDDTLPKADGEGNTDLGLRLIASAISAIVSLSLIFFLIHRLRQRKIRGRRNRQLSEEQRSMNSIGYIAGSIGYLPGNMGYISNREHIDFAYDSDPRTNFVLWKPPAHYYPRGEAPPPYEEAVAAAQAEAMAAAVSLPPVSAAQAMPQHFVSIALVPGNTTGTLHREQSGHQVDVIPNLSSLPPPPEFSSDSLHVIRSDAFYEDVQLTSPSSLVEYVNVEQTRAPEVVPDTVQPARTTNLTTMNDLNKSTCSCPDDNDDYRSECENCKSTHGSRYLEPEQNITPHETMTLQRRPPSLTPNTANGYGTRSRHDVLMSWNCLHSACSCLPHTGLIQVAPAVLRAQSTEVGLAGHVVLAGVLCPVKNVL
ncbi:hypothetical protein B566_EDAN009127 [Ephemera danica]|nr:hypothetical protein B566_EDAN009127 [Ephemera danica]